MESALYPEPIAYTAYRCLLPDGKGGGAVAMHTQTVKLGLTAE